jgi:tetratricopeptide (TPR) repeat protein
MNNKFTFCFLTFLLLQSCSSFKKSDNTLQKIETNRSPERDQKKLTEPKSNESNAETSVPPTITKYSALDSAIESKNSERIKNQSLDMLLSEPKDLKALNALAMSYFNQGKFEAAFYLLNKVLRLDPGSSAAYNNLGLIYLQRNDQPAAIQMFKKSLELNSENYLAASNLGSIYVTQKDHAKAVLVFESVTNRQNYDELTLNNYAVALSTTGKTEEAVTLLEGLIEKNSSLKSALLNLSINYIEKLKKYDKGLATLDRLKFVGPDSDSQQLIKDLEKKAKAGLK